MPVVICPVLVLVLPHLRRCRTDVHQNNTRIRVLLSYSTSRRSRRQGIKERRLRRRACNVRTLLANASRIVTRNQNRSDSLSLAQLRFVRITSSITLRRDGCQYGYSYMYMHMYVLYWILGVQCCRFEKLVQGGRSQGSRWEKDNGSTKTISGQKLLPST